MKLGLIAGNGRFPFLVLEAARAQGHQVTVIATKEEAFKDLDENRAAGAVKLRVETIDYFLKRYREAMLGTWQTLRRIEEELAASEPQLTASGLA